MRKYGKHYVVYRQKSRHSHYGIGPETEIDIYGIYASLSKARKALRDCASIEEEECRHEGEVVSCRIVDEPDTIIIVKDWIAEGYRALSHNPQLITIEIELEF